MYFTQESDRRMHEQFMTSVVVELPKGMMDLQMNLMSI